MNIKITPQQLNGTIEAIPSKSHAHRLLIAQKLAALQGGGQEDPLAIPTFSEDIDATKGCLAQLDEALPRFDCRESGSTIRFMIPVAMALKDEAAFAGSGKLPQRPLSPLKEEMERHGCSFEMLAAAKGAAGALNCATASGRGVTSEICRIRSRLQPGKYELAGNISSQFITGLLFALPLLNGDSSLQLTTKLESAGYVDLTLQVLREFGIEIREVREKITDEDANAGKKVVISERAAEQADSLSLTANSEADLEGISEANLESNSENYLIRYEIPGNQIYREPEGLKVEGDWSNAAFWLVAGALGGNITCTGLNPDSTQRDKEIVTVLEKMGAKIERKNTAYHIAGNCAPLHGETVSAAQFPDLVPVMAVAMTGASDASSITNAERLRIKESDRLATVCDFLTILGTDIRQTEDGLIIHENKNNTDPSGTAAHCPAPPLSGGTVSSHNDHRIAMAAAVASCRADGPIVITGAEAVKKSYPDFFTDFVKLGGKIEILED